MTSQLPALRAPDTPPVGELVELGSALAASGYFKDATDTSQAIVKVLAGRELGLPPIASMTGIYIVEGKITLGANLMAAVVKRHPRYDYRVVELSDEKAEIAFFENGEQVGTSEFTMTDARRAGLADKQNFKRYPRNMLLWRALSNGAKFYCADAFSGAPVYTPDELGAEVDPETGEIIDLEAAVRPAPSRSTDPPRTVANAPQALTLPATGTESSSPTPPEAAPEPAAEGPATTSVEGRPDKPPSSAPADDATITEQEIAKLTEYLDTLGVPVAFWRMGLMSYGLSDLSELSRAQAHDLMVRARERFGKAAA